MADAARVLSIDSLAQLREALQRFGAAAQRALEGADSEVRRSVNAVEQRLQFWHNEVGRREEEVSRAKSELTRARWGHRDGSGPGTTEQEIALAKAQRRLKEAEEKEKLAGRWLRHLPQDIQDFEGSSHVLYNFLETELKQAVVLLGNKIESLEAYTRLAAPAAPSTQPTPADGGPSA